MSNLVTRILTIDGMHCTSCAMNIDFDLEDIPGVTSSKTNYAKQETVVQFDEGKVSIDDIILSIRKTGYTSQLKP